jgi:type I restriction enzyme S subunit
MTWHKVCIGDLGRVVTGDTPPKKNPEYYGSAYPFIKPTDMRVGERFTRTYEECYSETAYEKYSHKLIPTGATAVVTIGSIGQKLTLIETPSFVNQAVNAVIPDVSRFDSLFVYYLLRHNLHLVKGADTGASSGRENVSKSNFSGLDVMAPADKDQQARIAGILGGYDDLIENNRRRIALLEESARLLYREWFVHLRFPGAETVGIRNGTPEGWTAQSIGDIGRQIKEQADPRRLSADTAYLSMEHMSSKSFTLGLWESAAKVSSSKLRFEADDVLFGRIRPYFHKVGIAQVSGVTSTDVIVVRAASESLLPLVALTMSSDEFVAHAVTTSNGTKMPRADWKVLREWPVQVPDSDSLEAFAEKVLPMFRLCKALSAQNRYLQEARDALLPKLMSGEIAV